MFGCPKAQLKQSAPSGTGPSVKAADVFLPLGESSAQPLLPSKQKAAPAALMERGEQIPLPLVPRVPG